MTKVNLSAWLTEQDIPMLGGQPDMAGGQAPSTQPGIPGNPMLNPEDMPPPDQDPAAMQNMEPDISEDPQFPDMPESEEEEKDFESWKMNYIKESIKGDQNILVDMIMEVRDRELDSADRKFIEDNLQVQFLRGNANVDKASKEIRKRIKQELDRQNPATTVVNHITDVMEENPILNEVYIKLLGLTGAKGDLYRKYVAALIGGIQVGSGANTEDVVFEEKEYSIRISTRFNARFGDINIGRWALREDDPERYLSKPELARLEAGSPEEKDVLRRRVVLESIAELFKERAFLMTVTGNDGTVHHLGWDLGNSLNSAYTEGKLVVRTEKSDNSEAIIDDDGQIIPSLDWYINYVKEAGSLDDEGEAELEEIEFMQRRDGMLFLTAQLDILKEASANLQGMVLKEIPWRGNPNDIMRISRCVPSAPEMIMRQC